MLLSLQIGYFALAHPIHQIASIPQMRFQRLPRPTRHRITFRTLGARRLLTLVKVLRHVLAVRVLIPTAIVAPDYGLVGQGFGYLLIERHGLVTDGARGGAVFASKGSTGLTKERILFCYLMANGTRDGGQVGFYYHAGF